MSTKRVLTLAFLRPTLDDPFMNRLTGRVSRHNVCHVELHFDLLNQCFSIIYGEHASLRFKNLSNPNYELVSISVTAHQYENCLNFCKSMSQKKLDFDDHAMYRSFLCPGCCERRSSDVGKTFCSKIITEALQHAGVPGFVDLNPAVMTPSRLMDVAMDSPFKICNSVPYKCQAMINTGVVTLNTQC